MTGTQEAHWTLHPAEYAAPPALMAAMGHITREMADAYERVRPDWPHFITWEQDPDSENILRMVITPDFGPEYDVV